jgi:hypothetical protein
MPAFIGRFDLVIGNPPWVNWESLPTAYRERTRPIWESSGLFVHGGMTAMLGAGKKDVAMLMSYVATDKLLREGGRLAFVITQTVFKTAGAGQGFRRFRVGDNGPAIKVERVDDLTDLNPFVGATNRTALVTWRRDEPTRYPVKYVVWQRRTTGSIDAGRPLESVMESVRLLRLVAAPVQAADRTSAWMSAPRGLMSGLRKLGEAGEPVYRAHEGVNTGGANGISWIAVEGSPDARGRVAVSNLHDIGKRELPKRYGRVESDLIHPLVRGSDVRRWSATPSLDILFVQDVVTRRGLDATTMATRYPGALAFLEQFETELRARAAFGRYFTTRAKGGSVVETGPYWSMFNVGTYTLARHKVVWKDIATDFAAAVIDPVNPVALSSHSVIEVACESADEAHFLCGLLNSIPARTFVAAYVAIHISTHTVETIQVPRYDATNPAHAKVVQASRAAHKRVRRGLSPDEDAVDRAAATVWGIKSSETSAMRTFLERLLKRDLART